MYGFSKFKNSMKALDKTILFKISKNNLGWWFFYRLGCVMPTLTIFSHGLSTVYYPFVNKGRGFKIKVRGVLGNINNQRGTKTIRVQASQTYLVSSEIILLNGNCPPRFLRYW